jgi:hypothetical protein
VGREISYCHSCGHRLVADESGDRGTRQQDGRWYCATCCPSQPVPAAPAAQRRHSSTRLRAQASAPRNRESTRIRKRSPLRIVLPAAALVALALGIAIGAGGGSSAPLPGRAATVPAASSPAGAPAALKPDPSASVDELLCRIRELRESDLLFERRDQVVRLLREAGARAGGRLEQVDQLAADYDRKFEEAASRLADFTRSEALRMAAKQKYGEAIDRLDGYPAAFRASPSAGPLRMLRQDLERRRAESAVHPAPQAPRRVISFPEWRCPSAARPRLEL